MRRLMVVALAASMTLGLLLTGCAKAPAPTAGPARVTIGLSYIPDIQFAPFYVAETRGLFGGLDATLRHHGASEGLFTALQAGQEDFVLAGGDEAVQARAQGMDVVAVGQYYRSYPVVFIVPDTSDVHSVADLRGRSIGVPGRFGETWFGLLAALQAAGLTLEDVTIVEVGYTQQAALTTGKVEAIVGFSNNDQVKFITSGVPVRAVPLDAAKRVPLESIALIAKGSYVSAHQDTVKAVVSGMTEGMKATVAAPATAITDAKAFIPTLGQPGAEAAAQATLAATVPLWTTQGGSVSAEIDKAAWSDMCQFMLDQGLLASPVKVDEVVSSVA